MDPVPRPEPPQRLADRLRDWIEWLGPARLATSAVAVVVVCAGAWFLLRQPVPPPERDLPRPTATTAPVATLAPPAGTSAPAPPPDVSDGTIVVHVAGAVERPGVYELAAGSRTIRAIDLAGGPTADAELDRLNLAAPLVDGQRIHVPLVGEETGPVLHPPPDSATGIPPSPSGPVDVNVASVAELDTLPGVGPATAEAIVAERERNGPFAGVDDLERVPGIGPAKLARLRDAVTT